METAERLLGPEKTMRIVLRICTPRDGQCNLKIIPGTLALGNKMSVGLAHR
jgi:hypothetical protein